MIRRLHGSLLLAITISACTHPQLKHIAEVQQNSDNRVQQQSYDYSTLSASVSQGLSHAKAERWDITAPLHYRSAISAHELALQLAKRAPESKQSIAQLLTAETLLAQAEELVTRVERFLKPSLTQLKHLEALKAPILFPKDYEAQLDNIRELAMLIENGKHKQALASQVSVQEALTHLEKRCLESRHTHFIDQLLESMYTQEADYYAPAAANKAEHKVAHLKQLIALRNRDTKALEAAEKEAVSALETAITLGKESKKLVGLNSSEAERAVMHAYARLERPYALLTQQYPQGQSLESASQIMAREIEQLQTQLTAAQKALTQLKGTAHSQSDRQESSQGERYLPPEEGPILTLKSLPAHDRLDPPSQDATLEESDQEQTFDGVEYAR